MDRWLFGVALVFHDLAPTLVALLICLGLWRYRMELARLITPEPEPPKEP